MENVLCKECGFSLSFLRSGSGGCISVWCPTVNCPVYAALPEAAWRDLSTGDASAIPHGICRVPLLNSLNLSGVGIRTALWRIGQVSCRNILPRICSVSSWVAQTVFLISLNSPQSRIVVSCRNYKKLFKAFLGRVYYIRGTVLIR